MVLMFIMQTPTTRVDKEAFKQLDLRPRVLVQVAAQRGEDMLLAWRRRRLASSGAQHGKTGRRTEGEFPGRGGVGDILAGQSNGATAGRGRGAVGLRR